MVYGKKQIIVFLVARYGVPFSEPLRRVEITVKWKKEKLQLCKKEKTVKSPLMVRIDDAVLTDTDPIARKKHKKPRLSRAH